MPSVVQSVLFDRTKYDATEARTFLKRHRFNPIKRVHKTKNYLRYRLRDPDSFDRFATKTIVKKRIHLVIGFY